MRMPEEWGAHTQRGDQSFPKLQSLLAGWLGVLAGRPLSRSDQKVDEYSIGGGLLALITATVQPPACKFRSPR